MAALTNLSGPAVPDEVSEYLADPNNVRRDIAADILTTVHPGLIRDTVESLSGRIMEIQYQSNVQSPDLLILTIIDPDWTLQDSPLCETSSEGIFNPVDINFPKPTDVWWRLNLITNSGGDVTQPVVQLQFQHRLVSYLQADWGPLKVAPGTKTRAQFIKQLVDRIPQNVPSAALGPGSARSQQIQFVCPELNIVQPLDDATGSPTSTTKVTLDKTEKSRKVNKTRGISAGASLTAKGSAMSPHQIHIANLLLDQGHAQNAPANAMYACMFDAIFESDIGVDNGWNSAGYGGALGGSVGNFGHYGEASSDAVATAEAIKFFAGGEGFQGGGAIALCKKSSDIAYIGSQTTAATPFDSHGYSTQYEDQHFPFSTAIAEAKAIVAAYGGAAGGSTTETTGSATTTSTTSDVSTLTRGSSSNPDEDSWTCIQRLAQGVNWEAFTSAHPASGQWGNYLYYMSGPENDAQTPAAYLRRSTINPGTWDLYSSFSKPTMKSYNVLNQQPAYTVDNQAFTYRTTKTKYGKIQRAVSASKYVSQTPTQIQIEMVCGPMEYNAGDVLYFERSGALNGRWIITETDRNMIEDVYDTLYLSPPTAPTPEPARTSTTTTNLNTSTTSPTGGAGSGTALAAYNAAKVLGAMNVPYVYGGGHDGFSSNPPNLDCSGAVSWVLWRAGMIDAPADSTALESWGAAGPGKEMTVWTNATHAFIDFHIPGLPKMQLNTVSPSGRASFESMSYSNADAGTQATKSGAFTPRHYPGT